MTERSPFMSPMDKRDQANEAKASFADPRSQSDHITLINAFNGWAAERERGGYRAADDFCMRSFLSMRTMKTIAEMKHKLRRVLVDAGFEEAGGGGGGRGGRGGGRGGGGRRGGRRGGGRGASPGSADRNADNMKLVSALVVAGLYPDVARVEHPEARYKMVIGGAIAKDHEAKKIRFYGSEGRLFLHPSSVNFQVQLYRHLCVAYSEKVRTSKIFIRDVTVASPYALLIFGGEPRLHFEVRLMLVVGEGGL